MFIKMSDKNVCKGKICTMISIRNLRKSYPDSDYSGLKGINLDIDPGELVVVIGASGSGKTTFLRCISLYEKWDSGKLFYKDQDIFEMGLRGKFLIRKEFAYIEEKPSLHPRKSAIKNVLRGSRKNRPLWRKLTGLVPESEYVNGMDYLEKAGLLNKAERIVENMSGGEVQRVAIAKALAQGASVVVADEPVSNLDPHTAGSIMSDIRQLCEKQGLTVICTLHQVDLAERYATRKIGLAEGSIVFDVSGRPLTLQEKRLIE